MGNHGAVANVQPVMKRLTVLTILPALAVLAAGCGDADSTSDPLEAPVDASIPAVVSEPVPSSEPSDAPVGSDDDSPTEELAGDQTVFVWTETGGCAQGGPNCGRYEVTVDGTVSVTRAGPDAAGEPEATGQIDAALVQAWRDAVAAEDIDALRERVGVGEMTAAFDGTDYTLTNPVTGLELSSVETNFDPAESAFSTAFAVAAAAREAAPLEFEMR